MLDEETEHEVKRACVEEVEVCVEEAVVVSLWMMTRGEEDDIDDSLGGGC